MTQPIICNRQVYVPISSEQLADQISELQTLHDDVLAAEQQITGSCPEVEDGWTREIEFSAKRLYDKDLDFERRWQAWDRRRSKFLFYPKGESGNAMFRNTYKPRYDAQKKALECNVVSNIGGSPSLGTLNESQLFGYGTDTQPRYIKSGRLFRLSVDLEFSPNTADMLRWAKVHSNRDPWMTLIQVKNSGNSWYTQFTMMLDWDRVGDHLRFMLRGDTRTERPPGFSADDMETSINVHDLEMPINRRATFEVDCRLDPTGQESITRVWFHGRQILDTPAVNCVPASSTPNQCRGVYFGTYVGNVQGMLPEPFSVWYSNMCIDVQDEPA